MDFQLKNKIALVTGSSAGIGYAIAKALAKEGATVYINGRKKDELIKAAEKLSKESGNSNIKTLVADFSKQEEVKNVFKELPEVDILVNNVGIFEQKDFEETDDELWMQTFEVNVMSGVRLSRHYFPKMLKKNDNGRLIFISSESGFNIPTEMVHYGVSKTAQLALSRGLARLTKGTSVTVNSVLPGPTWSRSLKEAMEETAEKENKSLKEVEQEFLKENRPTSLIQRFAETEEVANMVAYVASPLSSATNGDALRVDGGVVNSII